MFNLLDMLMTTNEDLREGEHLLNFLIEMELVAKGGQAYLNWGKTHHFQIDLDQ